MQTSPPARIAFAAIPCYAAYVVATAVLRDPVATSSSKFLAARVETSLNFVVLSSFVFMCCALYAVDCVYWGGCVATAYVVAGSIWTFFVCNMILTSLYSPFSQPPWHGPTK